MKFEFQDIQKIRDFYESQVREFVKEHRFLFPKRLNNAQSFELWYGDEIIVITECGVEGLNRDYDWDDLSIEDLEYIMSTVLEDMQTEWLKTQRRADI